MTPRIVSLIASATEILDALGQTPFVVGRSHECDFPPEIGSRPVCTRPLFDVSGSSSQIDALVKSTLGSQLSVYEVFPEVLRQLNPTHIVTQIQCEVCAVSLADVQRSLTALGLNPVIVALQPNSLADIWDDFRRVAGSLGVDAEPVIAALQARMSEISSLAGTAPVKPTVACVEWLAPLMAAGNWCPELVELAGGINQFGTAGAHSPWMTWDDLTVADPDIVIAMPCGFDLERTAKEMYWMTGNPAFGKLKAARTGRVYLADGNQYFNRPGPRVVESLRIMAEILHPDLFEPSLQGSAWTFARDYNFL